MVVRSDDGWIQMTRVPAQGRPTPQIEIELKGLAFATTHL